MGSFLNDTLSTPNYGSDGVSSSSRNQKTKMDLTVEAAKEIFSLLDEDERIGIIAFDNVVEIIEVLKIKGDIDKDRLFDHLDTITPRGGTNMEIGMEKQSK